jgi:hypothetical protein
MQILRSGVHLRIPPVPRAGLLSLVAALALLHAAPPVAQADAVNVGNNPVQVVFCAPQDGATSSQNPCSDPSWRQLTLNQTGAALICGVLPAQDCAQVTQIASSPLLSQNLGQYFDAMWSKTVDKATNETRLQETCDGAKQQVASNISSSTGQSAYNISCKFPSSGGLTAGIGSQEDTSNCPQRSLPASCAQSVPAVGLDYKLSGMEIDFAVTKPNLCDQNVGTVIGNIFTGGAGCIADTLPDPTFSVTFAVNVNIEVKLPAEPCAMWTDGAEAFTSNANINSSNFSGGIVQSLSGLYGAISPDNNAFPAAEQTMDNTIVPFSTNLGSDLTSMEQGCSAAVYQGFSQFTAVADPNKGLMFELIHPLDQAQITSNGSPATNNFNTPPGGVPSLINSPQITASPLTVPAGGSVTVAGNYFAGSNASEIQIAWNDPGDEQLALKASDIQWGIPGSLTTVTKQRTHDDAGATFDATNLKPNTKYEFMVRDCDNVACSMWSNPLYVTTGSSTGNQVTINLDGTAIGTAMPDPNGSFSQPVQIPAQTTAGKHSLTATGGNKVASPPIQITVLGANQAATPQLSVVDTNENLVVQSVEVSFPYTLEGSYFTPGGTVSIYVDTASGKPIATATVGGQASDGTFQVKLTMPSTAAGNHTLLAVETVNGQTIQATDSVFVQALPQ